MTTLLNKVPAGWRETSGELKEKLEWRNKRRSFLSELTRLSREC